MPNMAGVVQQLIDDIEQAFRFWGNGWSVPDVQSYQEVMPGTHQVCVPTLSLMSLVRGAPDRLPARDVQESSCQASRGASS